MRNAIIHRNGPLASTKPGRYSQSGAQPAQLRETVDAVTEVLQDLPPADNAPGAVEKMLRANAILRNVPWPPPFDQTQHRVLEGDARNLSCITSESVQLVVTSPPYWTLKEYEPHEDQLGAITDYERFLTE